MLRFCHSQVRRESGIWNHIGLISSITFRQIRTAPFVWNDLGVPRSRCDPDLLRFPPPQRTRQIAKICDRRDRVDRLIFHYQLS